MHIKVNIRIVKKEEDQYKEIVRKQYYFKIRKKALLTKQNESQYY